MTDMQASLKSEVDKQRRFIAQLKVGNILHFLFLVITEIVLVNVVNSYLFGF